MYVPDNLDRWEAHDRAMEVKLSMLPKCHCCGEPIQSEYAYGSNGKYICEDCLERHYQVPVEDLM